MTVRYIQGKTKGPGGSYPSKQSKHGSDVESHTEFSVLAADDAASIVSQLENPRSFLRGGTDDDKIKLVEELFHKGAAIGVGVWVILMIMVYLFSPYELYEEPSGFEQLCHIVGGTLLIVSNGARLLPLLMKDKGYKILKSGFIVGSLAVQLVALASNYIMAFRPTPVMYDEISGLRFHLVRWAEWIPLAFSWPFSPLTSTHLSEGPLRLTLYSLP
ncbi:Histidine ATPase [Fragilaria crotonensis]|nr:Histidine ATPase [Fragilaria crotonensis]